MSLQTADRSLPVEYYDGLAASLAPAYDSISFDQANAGVLLYLPAAPARVLDVGAGSGRDARALAALGHQVVAVEPSLAFRTLAERRDDRVTWMDDRLPDLPIVLATGGSFKFILCSAVLMLVPSGEIGRSFATLASLLDSDGRLAVSLRAPAAGEPTGVFHAHSDADVLHAAAQAGLTVIDRSDPPDALGRASLTWRSYVFGKPEN